MWMLHIPDHFDESDAESETLSEKLRQIDAYQENEQGGTQVDEDQSNQQVWYMEVDPSEDAVNQAVNLEIQNQNEFISLSSDIVTSALQTSQENNQAEKESVVADVLNSQKSVIIDDGQNSTVVIGDAKKDEKNQEKGQDGISQPERRSERLKKEIHLTTMEKNEAMAKKRSLEGNSNKSHALATIDNIMLNDLAKNMGVLVSYSVCYF